MAAVTAERAYLAACRAPADRDGLYELQVTDGQLRALLLDDAFRFAVAATFGRDAPPGGDFAMCGIRFARTPGTGRSA